MTKLLGLQNFGNAVRAARHKEKKSQSQLCKQVEALLPDGSPNFYQEKLSKIERAVPTLALTKEEIQILQQVCKLEDSIVEPLLKSLKKMKSQENIRLAIQTNFQASIRKYTSRKRVSFILISVPQLQS